MILYTGGGNGPQTEGIQKRQVIFEEEKVGVSLKVEGREFSRHILLDVTEDKQVKPNIRGRIRDIIHRYGHGSTRIQEQIDPIERYTNSSSALEFYRVLHPNLR